MSSNLNPESSSNYGGSSSRDFESNVGSFKSDSYNSSSNSSSSYEKKELPKKSLKLGFSKKKVSLLENLVQQGEVQREEEEEETGVNDVIEKKSINSIPTEK